MRAFTVESVSRGPLAAKRGDPATPSHFTKRKETTMHVVNDTDPEHTREVLIRSVTHAVGALFQKRGIDPAIVFEGAIRGGAAALIAAGATAGDVSEVLTQFALAFEDLEQSPPVN